MTITWSWLTHTMTKQWSEPCDGRRECAGDAAWLPWGSHRSASGKYTFFSETLERKSLLFWKKRKKKNLTFSLKRMIFKTLTLWLKWLSREKNYYTEYPKTSSTNCLGKSWNYMVPTVWLSSLCSDSNLSSCILYFVVSGHKCSPRMPPASQASLLLSARGRSLREAP